MAEPARSLHFHRQQQREKGIDKKREDMGGLQGHVCVFLIYTYTAYIHAQ